MKKVFSFVLSLLMVPLLFAPAYPQTGIPKKLLYGVSPFQDSLWGVDTTNGFSIVKRMAPYMSGYSVTGMNGLAFDPVTKKTYGIAKISGVAGRVLVTVDLNNAVLTWIGNLGDNFSSLTFDRNGQLYGTTGNGATVPETFYMIDKATSVKTLMFAMGNGADGEVICYNPADNFFYHWSGNGTMVFEKFTTSGYTPVNIPVSGTTGGETFGAMYASSNDFIISNISSTFKHVSTSGVWGPNLCFLPDDLRGIVMPPAFGTDVDSVCLGQSVTLGTSGMQAFKSVVHWGDGIIDTLTNDQGVHTFAAAGDYTIEVELYNGYVPTDSIWARHFHVNPYPAVTLSGSHGICPADSVLITGVAESTMQWYKDGVAIPGATGSTFYASQPGMYNQYVINHGGCSDSSATGFNTFFVPNPVVNLGNDDTLCGGIMLDAQNPGFIYQWSNAQTTQTIYVNTTGDYSVTVTSPYGCTERDTVSLLIYPNPLVNLGVGDTVCGGTTLDAQNAGSLFLWSTTEVTQSINVSASGSYWVQVTDINGCFSRDTVDILVNPIPVVTYIESQDTVCLQGGTIALSPGNPAGGTYSGTAVTGTFFDPATAGAGSVSIVYSYTDVNGCTSSDTSVVYVDNCAGVNAPVGIGFSVYPNPTQGTFTLELSSGSRVDIYAAQGKRVFSQYIEKGQHTLSPELEPGVYILNVLNSHRSSNVRLLIQK